MMNIWNIAKNGFKTDFRDRRTLVFMLLFPIVLMLVLGSALSNAFDSHSQIKIGDMTVLYKDNGGSFSPFFQAFAREVESSGVHFKAVGPDVDAMKEVETYKATGYLEITEQGAHLYGSAQSTIESNIVQAMLSTFVDQYNVAAELAKLDPKAAAAVFTSPGNHTYIQEASLNSVKKPGSMDYYAIAMTTMIALYAAMGSSYLITGERLRKTGERLIAAPISKTEIFTGKVLGSLAVNFLCILVIVLFSKYAFNAYWGDHLGQVFAVFLTEVILAVSLGLGLSYIAENGARMIVMVFVQVASFLGGAYFPMGDAEGIFALIGKLNPLQWTNTAVTQIVYSNDFSAGLQAILLNLGLAALFLLVSIVSMRRKEGL